MFFLKTKFFGWKKPDSTTLTSHDINKVWMDHHGRDDSKIESFINSLRTRQIHFLNLLGHPIKAKYGCRVAQALASNAHITKIDLSSTTSNGMKPMMQWFTKSTWHRERGTLAGFTNLEMINVHAIQCDYFLFDLDSMFQLFLTSTSLQELKISVIMTRASGPLLDDRFVDALAQYLIAATRVRKFALCTDCNLSQAAFLSLCDVIAGSKVHELTLELRQNGDDIAHFETETVAEYLAQAIAKSSLEEVRISSRSFFRTALLHTQPVQNLDFAFSVIDDDSSDRNHTVLLKVHRQWKSLLINGETIPLALWPRILAKSHAETSHGPAGLLFHILREKPDLLLR